LNSGKFTIVYIGRDNNIHDQRFVRALSEIFEVREIYTNNLKSLPAEVGIFSNASLVLAGPLTDAISAIPLEVSVPILGISHAFDLNIEFSNFPIVANIDRCKAIFSDCKYVTSILRDTYGFERDIYEIPWGCDRDYFSKAKIKFSKKPQILVTRNWYNTYRNDVIISALESLNQKNLEFECTFIGDGPLLENQIQNLHSNSKLPNVRFLKRQEKNEIRDAMSKNWMYISAASSDGTSISLLEAMAAGMICITTDFPSNCEWIENAISGFIFRNGDTKALAALIQEVSSLSLEEKASISRTAKEIVARKGDLRNNQKAFLSCVISNVQ
jgi:glycosyltransferase involved in cell wall biosynthesis